MPRHEPRVRLFIAIYPPRACVRALADAAASLDLPPHRPVPIDQIHLTVHFVGPVHRREVDRVRETLSRAARGIGTFELQPHRLIVLPPRDCRLVAAETNLPSELAELQRRLASRLASKPSRRAYLPHITLCRFRAPRFPGFEPVEINIPTFGVNEICLMRSVLHPDGAEHRMLACTQLDGP
ncbi:MAG: RNA 2',3'-cyclic phosphodiesterase [Planctomycetota bacterium]|nr:MAG: RNA 2',3'-cyclic phosphodiesterase [Planctomycetota bacterium]